MLDPWESASVAEYRNWALAAVAGVEARGKRALFVGGTALYLKALLRGLFAGPGADPARRRALEDEAERDGDAALHARLAALDPVTATRLHTHDRRRVVRALEVIAATGRPLSQLQNEHSHPAPAGVAVFALERPRAELCARIDGRVVADVHRRPGRRGPRAGGGRSAAGAGRRPGGGLPRGARPPGWPRHARPDGRPRPGPVPAVRQAAGDLVPWPGRGSALACRHRRVPRGDRRAAGRGDREHRSHRDRQTDLPRSAVICYEARYSGRPLRRVRRVPGCARVCFAPKGPRKASIGAVPKEGSRFPWTGDSSLFSSAWHWPCSGLESPLVLAQAPVPVPSLPPVPPVEPAPLPAEALPPPAAMPPPNESPAPRAEACAAGCAARPPG